MSAFALSGRSGAYLEKVGMMLVAVAAIYFFLLFLLFSPITAFPGRVITTSINRKGLFGHRVSSRGVSAITLGYILLGLGLWFALCVIPVTLFAGKLNALVPPLIWFIAPMILGMSVSSYLKSRNRGERT